MPQIPSPIMKNLLRQITILVFICFSSAISVLGFDGTTVQEDTAEVNFAFRLLEEIKSADRFINTLDSLYTIDLPVGIATQDDKEAENYAIAVHQIKIRNGKGYLDAYMAFTIPGTTKKVAFKGVDIPFSFSGGVKDSVKLYLVSDFAVELSANTTMILRGSGNTNVVWDCNGFKEMNVVADIVFDSTLFVPENPDGTTRNEALRTSFRTTITDWNDLMVGVSIEPFQLKPLKGVGFSVTNAVFDLSDFKNPANIHFTEKHSTDYFIDGNPNIWQGFYIQEAQVRMPPQFRKKTDNELSADSAAAAKAGVSLSDSTYSDSLLSGRLSFYAQNLLIDELGFTALLGATDLLNLDEGDLSGWDFSVKSLSIDIQTNQLVSAGFSGQVRVPLLKDNNLLNYSATIGLNGTYAFTAGFADTLQLPLWAADLMLEPNSSLTISATDKYFVPSLCLNGMLTVKAPTEKVDTTSPKLELLRLTFQGMHIQTASPYFSVDQISYGSQQNRFSKFPVTITEVGIVNDDNRVGLTVGLNVHFTGDIDGAFAGDGLFTLWGKKEDSKWKYDGIDIGLLSVDISKPNAFSLYGSVLFMKGDKIYGNGFKGELKANFAGFEMQASALFGNVNDYRYWYADALFASTKGLPVGPIAVYGFGGGAFYHVRQSSISDTTASEISRSLSGIVYSPDKTSGLALKASVKFGLSGSENTMNGDAEFMINFQPDGGINQIGFTGNAYFATNNFEVNTSGILDKAKYVIQHTSGEVQIPKETESSQLYGNISMLYDFPNKCFHANFDIYADIAGGIIKGIGPGGKAGWGVMHFQPSYWYVNLGTPENPNGINVLNLAKMTNYFMAGTDIPGMPLPPTEVLSGLSSDDKAYPTERSTLELTTGKGFAFGAGFNFDTGDRKWLMFYGRFGCGLGFDILMKNNGNRTCENRSGALGINGWYAEGQAYGWIAANVGIEVDLPFYSGNYEIFDMGVAALLEAKAPNPFWMKGAVVGHYKILNGKVNGDFDFEFEIGEQCKLVAANPFGGMTIISEVKPANSETDVSVFTTPQVLFNLPVGETIEFEDENNKTRQYRIKLDYFKVGTAAGQPVKGSYTWNDRNDVLVFLSKEILPGETDLKADVRVIFEEYKNGDWFTVSKNGVVSSESKDVSFRTGIEPDYIPQHTVQYSYPGYRAFNYYKTEATTNFVKLYQGRTNLFNPGSEWVQKARIVPVSGGTATYFAYSYDDVNNQVNLSIPQTIGNNTIYRLELVNIPANTATSADENVEQETETQTVESEGYSADVDVTTQTAEESRTELQEKVIYGMEFRTSNYNTFSEKLNGLSYSDAITWELENPLIHSLTVNINGERFDNYEVVNLIDGTMIKCVPILSETTWYNTYISPLLNLSPANMAAIGAKPLELPSLTSYLFQSEGTRRLSEDEINLGSSSDVIVLSGMKNYIAKYTYEYMCLLQNKIVNTYLNEIPEGQSKNLLNSDFIPLIPGNYPVNIKYTLPEKTLPSTEKKYIMKFVD